MTELWRLDATALAQGIRAGEFSSRDAVASCLQRLHAVNPALNAVVDLRDDEALAEADAADRASAQERASRPLHGVPVTVKVNVDFAGRATTNGIVALRNAIAPAHSPVVSNLLGAGAVVIGRTNTPAFSMRWFTDNDLYGRTLNPWDAAVTPGGSSGGASAAVAAGIGPIAHGNDFGGSVRYPAYCTGVFGLRPSFGRVPAFLPSAAEERPLSAQLMSVQGPLARSVRDLRLALQAFAAFDPRDPWWVPAPLQGLPLDPPIRVAVTTTAGMTDVDAAVVDAVRRAARWLAEAGYAIDEVEPPDMAEAAALWDTLAQGEALHFLAAQLERTADEGMRRAFGFMTQRTPRLDAFGHMKALARRTTLIRRWQLFLQQYPLVLAPVSGEPPFPQGLDVESQRSMDRVLAAQAPQFSVPLLGLPAVAVPTGVAGGVPIGVQIIGRRFREDTILDAAAAIEQRYASPTPIDPVRR
ncbi:MAG TPA: amidase family protein [Burkholderiaceae bacterium]|nr:amidase family protein [Burkholderiaceae bacterium]